MSKTASLKVLLGDYPHTAQVKSGALKLDWLALEFVEAKPLNTAFKRMVRDLEFDISELSLATFLQAKDAGKPLVLMPFVLMSRFQHPYLVYDTSKGRLAPEQLSGRRIGCRLFTANTAVWLRHILARDHGVDLDSVEWVAFQKPHVAEFHDPANVREAPAGSDLVGLLRSGAVDAIVIDPVPRDADIEPVIANPEEAARRWAERNRAIQINHMIVTTETVCREQPDAVREFSRLLARNMRALGTDGSTPLGFDANRHNLDLAIDCVYSQKLIGRRFRVDELFNMVTAGLGEGV